MARKKSKKTINKDAWMATYGDMITLVLTFFIFLYSISTVSEEKWEKLVQALDNNVSSQIVLMDPENNGETLPGSEGPSNGLSDTQEQIAAEDINDVSELYEFLKQYIEQKGMQEQIEIGEGEGFVILRFQNDLFFSADSAALQPAAKEMLDVLAAGMVNLNDEVQLLRIDGHTATNPNLTTYTISTRKLSTDRANAVLEYVENKNVLDPVKMIAVGYGKYRPIEDNNTPEGRARNRRVEIYISNKSATDIDIDEVYKALAPE